MTTCPCGHQRFGYRVDGDTLERIVDGDKHHLHTPPGWALQKDVLDYHRPSIKTIVQKEPKTGKSYTVSADIFFGYARVINRTAGEQYLLTDRFWVVGGPGATDSAPPAPPAPAPDPVAKPEQLTLL